MNNDSFAAFVEKAEQSSQQKSYGQRDLEQIKWVGLEKNKPAILRFTGAAPNMGTDPADSKSMYISWIKGDDGSSFKCVRPNPVSDPNNIFSRLFKALTKGVWHEDSRQKSFILESRNPVLFNRVMKNGLTPADRQYNFERGWIGQEVYLMNVIDRLQADWHKENKHTMLLASNVTEKDGRTYVSEGVSKAALEQKFKHLFTSFGNWENYDIAITKTGIKESPYILSNASRVPEEVKAEYRKYIIVGDLTEEERAYEKYDLSKLFNTTTATKFYNRMKDTLKDIDHTLGTDFLREFKEASEAERTEWDKIYGTEDSVNAVAEGVAKVDKEEDNDDIVIPPMQEAVETPKAVRRSASSAESSAVTNPEKLPFFESELSEEDKQIVKDTFVSAELTDAANHTYKTVWNTARLGNNTVVECPSCHSASPETIFACPFCGVHFE